VVKEYRAFVDRDEGEAARAVLGDSEYEDHVARPDMQVEPA
jgi:hypothetical protein